MKKDYNIGWDNYYRQSNDLAWKEEPDDFLLENLNLLPKQTGLSVLDIASGDGRNTKVFFNNENSICCVDLSSTALSKIRDLCINSNLKVPQLISEDFLKVNFVENQFDTVICFDGLPQMMETKEIIQKICSLTKIGGLIIFNFFTKGDCAYGEGTQIDDNSFFYKETLFKFLNESEVKELLPSSVEIIKSELKRWDDPPHGEFRPLPHTHEAVFFALKRIN